MKGLKRVICFVVTCALFIAGTTIAAEAKILDTKTTIKIPTLTIVGDKWPCSQKELQKAWEKYYPLMVQILGEPCDDLKEDGIVLVMTEETLERRVNEFYPETNTIEMGIQVASQDKNQCISGIIHECGHLWHQVNDECVGYDFGQWIWEASTIIVERVLQAELLDPSGEEAFGVDPADLYDIMGFENVNGVQSDGDKAWRGSVDANAGTWIYYMNTVLSTPGTYDYWATVYESKQAYAEKHNTSIITKEVFMDLLDKAAGKKTIDGMKPSKWLFSHAVSNTNGKNGTFLNVWGNYVDHFGQDVRVNLYGYTRKDRVESGLAGTKVTVKVYNAKNQKKGSSVFKLNNDGIVDKNGIKNSKGTNVEADDFAKYSAVRYVATMTVDGKKVTASNYNIVLSKDDVVTPNDNRMFFVITDSKGKIVSDLRADQIKVSGAASKTTKYLKNGLLIVTAKQGKTVTVTVNRKKYKISKPAGARVVTINVK